jgi:hypothetical protein
MGSKLDATDIFHDDLCSFRHKLGTLLTECFMLDLLRTLTTDSTILPCGLPHFNLKTSGPQAFIRPALRASFTS